MEEQRHGGFDSIVGAWVLNLSRSDTMERFLQVTRVSEQGTRAHVRAEARHGAFNVIRLEGDTITIHKRTCANNFTESFKLGEEKVRYDGIVRTRISEVVSMPSSRPTGYVRSARSTAVSGGRDDVDMLESRHIMEGGLSHIQEIRLHNLTTGEHCVTNRVWTRVPMTDEHEATMGLLLLAEQPSSSSARVLRQNT
ncbi:unnamed protein product [Ectocarpus sp. 12 AP-2014]